MMATVLLAAAVAWGTGVALTSAGLPAAPRSWPGRLLIAVGGLGIGLGVHSAVFLAWRLLDERLGAGPWLLVALDGVTLAGAMAVWRWAQRRELPPTALAGAAGRPLRHRRVRAALLAAAGVAIALAALAAAGRLYHNPVGDWDAWAMWNLKATFLARAGAGGAPADAWRGLLSTLGPVGHRDYPLLLPATIARLWVYAGGEPPLVPQALAWAAVPLTALLLIALLGVLRNASQGALAALVLAATPHFADRAGTQYADSLLGFYELLCVGLVAFCLQRGGVRRRAWVLAGAAIGCAACTKNEGQVFALVMLVSILGASVFVERRGIAARLGPCLVGVAPFAACVAWVRLHAPPNADAAALLQSSLGRLALAPAEHRRVWSAIADLLGPALTWPLLGAVGLYALLAGLERLAYRGRVLAAAVPPLLAVPAVFYVFYLAVPRNVPPAITLDRVLAQVWPAALLLVFLQLRSPEELLGVSAAPPLDPRGRDR